MDQVTLKPTLKSQVKTHYAYCTLTDENPKPLSTQYTFLIVVTSPEEEAIEENLGSDNQTSNETEANNT